MVHKNIVFIAKSIDGFIAGPNGEIDWLDMVPNPNKDDMGYFALMKEVDAIVMGRVSFETVLGFNIPWPYAKHVFVLSKTLDSIPDELQDKVSLTRGPLEDILTDIRLKGYANLYIDGGKTVQNFLEKDLIHELRITTLPIVLGKGIPLFGLLDQRLEFEHVKTEVFLNQLVQSHYKRLNKS